MPMHMMLHMHHVHIIIHDGVSSVLILSLFFYNVIDAIYMYIYTSNPIHVYIHAYYDIKSILACSSVSQLILNYTVVSWDVWLIQFNTPLQSNRVIVAPPPPLAYLSITSSGRYDTIDIYAHSPNGHTRALCAHMTSSHIAKSLYANTGQYPSLCN